MKKTNLEIIKKVIQMGYTPKFREKSNYSNNNFHIVANPKCGDKEVFINNYGETVYKGEIDDLEITGFLYVGHLFGEPVIPEGAKFKIKETGKIGEFIKKECDLCLNGLIHIDWECAIECFSYAELEPVFE